MLSNTINGATGYGGAYIRYVWSATQSIPNNTSTISVNLYLVLPSGMSTNATETGNIYIDGAGSSYNNGTQYRTAGVHWLASYSRTINHNTDGTKTFSFSGQFTSGWSTLGTLSVSGSQTLDAIPRQANITSAPNFTDEENPTVGYSNPAGTAVAELKIALYNTAGNVSYAGYRDASKTGSSYTFNLTSDERTALLSATAGSNTMAVRFYLRTYLGGVYYYSYIDRTMTVVNGNPTFAGNYTYRDSNSTTSTITGNDQYFIQGLSTLELTILSANKATANKSATMSKYNASISSINQDITYTTSDIIQSLGYIGANGTTNLVVSAIDSRNNATSVSKAVNVLPYEVPQLTVTCSRVNNFETSTLFHISGVISRLTIGSVDKNTVNTSTGVQYRYKKVSDVSYSSWVNKTSSTSNGNVSVTDFNVDLDRNFAWNVQVKITDKLASTTIDVLVSVGIPIFRIGTDGKIYNNEIQVMPMIDEDTFASNLDTRVPTQQSVKAYVDFRPYKFSVYRNGNVSTVDGNGYLIIFNTKNFDEKNMFNTTTGKFTAPISGYYYLSARSTINGAIGAGYLWHASLALSIAGVYKAVDEIYVYDQGRVTFLNLSVAKLVYMTAGQEAYLVNYADTANSTSWVTTGNEISTNFSGFLYSL